MRNGFSKGAVISCFLFNIMINDLIAKLVNIHDVQCLTFVDDIAVFSIDQNIDIANKNIDISVKILEKWCEEKSKL